MIQRNDDRTNPRILGLKVKTAVKAGGLNSSNHGLKVRTAVKAGGLGTGNHGLKVKTAVKAGTSHHG